MNAADFVSVEKIIAEVTLTVNDKNLKNHDCLQELAFDTFYMQIQEDFDLPKILQLKMPLDTFNIREIYLYQGEKCNPSGTQVVHHKRLFNNNYNGEGYTARIKDDGSNSGDLFLSNQGSRFGNLQGFSGSKYYYNVQNGLMMFSADCAAFPYVRVIFNGMGGVDGSKPMIPRFFQRAIVDYVEERYYNAMKSRSPRTFRILWQDAYNRLNDLRTGSWSKARKRVSSMDSAEKESMEEYISSMYHK